VTDNARFDGSIPAAYDRYLGPLLFEPYAADLAARFQRLAPTQMLELACGTGILTRALRAALPPNASLTATDLNQPMLDYAQAKLTDQTAIQWRQADACSLPFPNASFDAVACQFGLMFVPDKPLAVAEARRVLRTGGQVCFSVWDDLSHNPLGRIAHDTITGFFPNSPPDFYLVPFGLSDHEHLSRLMGDAGFREVRLQTLALEGRSPSALEAATGLVTGNPILTALGERGITDAAPVITAVAQALARAGGAAPFRLPMQAVIVSGRAA